MVNDDSNRSASLGLRRPFAAAHRHEAGSGVEQLHAIFATAFDDMNVRRVAVFDDVDANRVAVDDGYGRHASVA
jgi:hypothetical protein